MRTLGFGVAASTNSFVEDMRLVHLPRKAIYEETTLAITPTMFSLFLVLLQLIGEGVLKKLDCDLTRHDFALLDILADKVSIFGTLSVLFCSQEITSYRKVEDSCCLPPFIDSAHQTDEKIQTPALVWRTVSLYLHQNNVKRDPFHGGYTVCR